MTTKTPTIEQAKQLAETFVNNHEVGFVLLFGSLARGESTERSDIDLVAVYDDLDYSQRASKYFSLREAADLLGTEVDLLVTDRPEWHWRSSHMKTTFEAGIKDDCIKLYDREPSPYTNWDKQIGLPMTEQGETRKRLNDCRNALISVSNNFAISDSERWCRIEEYEEGESDARYQRLKTLTSSATMSIEASLKALVCLNDKSPPNTYQPYTLINLLPGRLSEELCSLINAEQDLRLRLWRQAGTYSAAMAMMELNEQGLAEEGLQHTQTAIELAAIALREYEKRYGSDNSSDKLRAVSARVHRQAQSIDLITCEFDECVEQDSTLQPNVSLASQTVWLLED